MSKWIQEATERMKSHGTLGKFGKATESKIAAGRKAGGTQAKEANAAATLKKLARMKAK